MFQNIIKGYLSNKKNIAKMLNSEMGVNVINQFADLIHELITERYGTDAKIIITFGARDKKPYFAICKLKKVGISVWNIEIIKQYSIAELMEEVNKILNSNETKKIN